LKHRGKEEAEEKRLPESPKLPKSPKLKTQNLETQRKGGSRGMKIWKIAPLCF
jgi:hypothetical protein